MKLVYGSLAGLVEEAKEQEVEAVRVAGFMQSDVAPNGLPRYTAWVVVTALLDRELFTEWRLLVGRGHAELTEGGAVVPARIAELMKERVTEVRTRMAVAGLRVTASSRTTPRAWTARWTDAAPMRRAASSSRAAGAHGSRVTAGIRSRKVRQVVKLETRAARLLARYERTLACATPLLRRSDALRRQARAMELTLTGSEFAELRRFRSTTTH
jgi:hypothetical protein